MGSKEKDLYQLLGVNRNASDNDIKQAYKSMAKKHHPDKGGDEEVFKEIVNAYEILSDSQKRAIYDQHGMEGLQGGGGGPQPGGGPGMNMPGGFFWNPRAGGFFHHNGQPMGGGGLFEQFFHMSGGHGVQAKKPPVMGRITISLQEAFSGVTKEFKRNMTTPCPICKYTCDTCHGVGEVDVTRMLMPGMMQRSRGPCGACSSQGIRYKQNPSCSACKGQQQIKESKSLTANLPPGVREGYNVVFAGMGEPNTDGTASDLILQVVIQNNTGMERRDDNLIKNLQIPFIKTITGKSFTLTLPSQEVFTFYTHMWKEIIQPHKEYVIPEKGMPIFDLDNKRVVGKGHLIIKFNVEYDMIQDTMDPDDMETMEIMYNTRVRKS